MCKLTTLFRHIRLSYVLVVVMVPPKILVFNNKALMAKKLFQSTTDCTMQWGLFLLSYDSSFDLVTSQWQADKTRVSFWYLFYRLVQVLTFTAVYTLYIVYLPFWQAFFPIYLDNWANTLLLGFFFVDFVVVLSHLGCYFPQGSW